MCKTKRAVPTPPRTNKSSIALSFREIKIKNQDNLGVNEKLLSINIEMCWFTRCISSGRFEINRSQQHGEVCQ